MWRSRFLGVLDFFRTSSSAFLPVSLPTQLHDSLKMADAAQTDPPFCNTNSVLPADPDLQVDVPTGGVPRSVQELWADFDPRRDPLEVEVVREWSEEGGVFRLVRYLVGTFKGEAARMAAIYGFPEGGEALPAVMHLHGGGQRASLNEVKFFVAHGYAALSVNWGARANGCSFIHPPQGAQPGDPNTDWGAVDPSQVNWTGFFSLLPGPKQLFEDRAHPKNNNWYLLTLGCRRGLTFLETQPEVDPQRLGIHGFSMGANLAMFVAGTDERVKAAVPAAGGQGWRWEAHQFNGFTAKPQNEILGDLEVFRRTLSFESYAPLIRCPVLHRSATNDRHGWMDDVYRTNALIEGQPTRYSWAPHLSHRLTPEVEVGMPLWFEHFLKGGSALPETPRSRLDLDNPDGVPSLWVKPGAHPWPVAGCEVFFSVDPDPLARFWRSAGVVREEGGFRAKLPLHTLDLPLFAFANVYFKLPRSVSLLQRSGEPKLAERLCLSTLLHRADPVQLIESGVRATARPTIVIDDFSHGLRDWYVLNSLNPGQMQMWTRKVTDPMYRGPEGAMLRLSLVVPRTNTVTVVLHQNEWRNYRGPHRTFVCQRKIRGSRKRQNLYLSIGDFASADGPPVGWSEIDQIGICAHYVTKGAHPALPTGDVQAWRGPGLHLKKVVWVRGPGPDFR